MKVTTVTDSLRRFVGLLRFERSKWSMAPRKVQADFIRGTSVVLDERTLRVGGSWTESSPYDTKLLEWFLTQTFRFTHPVMLDIGANTGSFSLLPLINPTLLCYSFEPVPHIFRILRNNIHFNGLEGHTKAFKVALWHQEGSMRIKFPLSAGQASYACLGSTPLRFNEYVTMRVKTITLDEFVVTHGIGDIHLIKIDTEGAEKFVLEGGAHVIRTRLPDILLEYYRQNTQQFGYEPEVLLETLSQWGYRCQPVGPEDMYCSARKQ